MHIYPKELPTTLNSPNRKENLPQAVDSREVPPPSPLPPIMCPLPASFDLSNILKFYIFKLRSVYNDITMHYAKVVMRRGQ